MGFSSKTQRRGYKLTYKQTYERKEFLSILQDFNLYRGRCPASTEIIKKILHG